MSGGYTHITLTQLAIEEARNRHEGLLHNDAKLALGYWKKFCIIGAVAPDYPYLNILSKNSCAWADAMHKGRGIVFLRHGIAKIRDIIDDNVRQKCMAWLFGFAAHIVTDGTVHPVVNLKVGPYEQNKTEHRQCEMSQDVFAHKRLNLGALEHNRQISANVKDTSATHSPNLMDPEISQLWQDLLTTVYSDSVAALQIPRVDDWHNAMHKMMQLGESGNVLFPFARHVAANFGLVYPAVPTTKYIQGLQVPNGSTMDFQALFDKALNNILEMWGWLALSLQNSHSPLDTLSNWDLDTGINETGQMVYWG